MEVKNKETIDGAETKRLMRAQLQPHFIFNCLATIGALCRRDGNAAYQAVSDFADYLRTNLNSLTAEDAIPFSEELEHLKKYLGLEELRCGKSIDVRYDIQFTGFRVPAITLQPIVENAVIHGICRKESDGHIVIRSALCEDAAIVTVEDNGSGFDISILENERFARKGIANAGKRLEWMCGGALEVKSSPGCGAAVTVRIPLEQEL